MGCFDTVIIHCPGCGLEQEAQSKGGDCLLRIYTLQDAPVDVFSDINRHAPFTCDCGTQFKVTGEVAEEKCPHCHHSGIKIINRREIIDT